MVRGFYAQLVDALKAAGYSFKRQGKGDHEIWSKSDHRQIRYGR